MPALRATQLSSLHEILGALTGALIAAALALLWVGAKLLSPLKLAWRHRCTLLLVTFCVLASYVIR